MVIFAHWLLCRKLTGVETGRSELLVIWGGKDGNLAYGNSGREKDVTHLREFPSGSVVRPWQFHCAPWVQSLAGELRSPSHVVWPKKDITGLRYSGGKTRQFPLMWDDMWGTRKEESKMILSFCQESQGRRIICQKFQWWEITIPEATYSLVLLSIWNHLKINHFLWLTKIKCFGCLPSILLT